MTVEYSLQSFAPSNTITCNETVPDQCAAQSNRHLSAMLRTADKCLDVMLHEVRMKKQFHLTVENKSKTIINLNLT